MLEATQRHQKGHENNLDQLKIPIKSSALQDINNGQLASEQLISARVKNHMPRDEAKTDTDALKQERKRSTIKRNCKLKSAAAISLSILYDKTYLYSVSAHLPITEQDRESTSPKGNKFESSEKTIKEMEQDQESIALTNYYLKGSM